MNDRHEEILIIMHNIIIHPHCVVRGVTDDLYQFQIIEILFKNKYSSCYAYQTCHEHCKQKIIAE